MPVVAVTGSGRGIGKSIAVRFAREGWRVVMDAKGGGRRRRRRLGW
jgi:3-oxoacyl-[acyl-carrier protein] reductase